MLCQKCGKRPASTHIQRSINGVTRGYHLCSDCAAKLQLTGFSLNDLLGNFFMEPMAPAAPAETVRCPGCGCSFDDIAQVGKAGCPQCYETFYDRLLPTLQRIHGRSRHVGRVPSAASPETKKENEIEQLKAQMERAIAEQAFEEAARLRDEIKRLEGAGDHE